MCSPPCRSRATPSRSYSMATRCRAPICSRSPPGPTCPRRRSSARRRTSGPTTACESSRPRGSSPSPVTPRSDRPTPCYAMASNPGPRATWCRSAEKGLVHIKIDGERLLLALPEPQFREPTPPQIAAVAEGLGVMTADIQRAAIIDVGPVWFTVQLASGDVVRALSPDMGKLVALNPIGITGVNVFGLYPRGGSADIEVRSFAPGEGVPEDPVCGSGNGCVAALVRRDGVLKAHAYVASQGRCLGRDGQVTVRFDTSTIWLGGHAVTCVEGSLQS